ncbi:MAG: CAP domain-containing protein [Desulfocucumaceae bacterium]
MFTGGQRDSGSPATPTGGGSGTVPQTPQQPPQQTGLSADETLLVSLINQERAKAGLPALALDSRLSQVARLKALDFVNKGYFGHTSPTYGTYRNMLTSYGVRYVNAGENLVSSYTAARAHTALMNSTGNRANILKSNYSCVGIGIADNGSYKYFVEMFTDGGAVQPPSGGGTAQPPAGSGSTQPPATQPTDPGTGTTSGLTADEQRMLSSVNAERVKNGLSALTPNLKLTGVARLKAKDLIDKNYFGHTSPTYGSPFDMMHQFGITYRTAGENLAGAPSVDTAHTNLMNSPGHRANILNSSFREVGIGVIDGGPYGKMFVQMFIG